MQLPLEFQAKQLAGHAQRYLFCVGGKNEGKKIIFLVMNESYPRFLFHIATEAPPRSLCQRFDFIIICFVTSFIVICFWIVIFNGIFIEH